MDKTITTYGPPKLESAPTDLVTMHASPDANNKSAAEYVYEAMKLHHEQYKGLGTPPPKLLKWFGDASLSNEPKNRMASAAGLTAGLLTTGTLASIVTGYNLSGKKISLMLKINTKRHIDEHVISQVHCHTIGKPPGCRQCAYRL